MKKVIVLMDNENRDSQFINSYSFGKSTSLMMLCRSMTKAEQDGLTTFKFEVFGLLTKSAKLDEFIPTHDGIIISIDASNLLKFSKEIGERISVISTNNKNIPIAVVIDHDRLVKLSNNLLDSLKSQLTVADIHELFVLPYIKQTGSLIGDQQGLIFITKENTDSTYHSDSICVGKWIEEKLHKSHKKYLDNVVKKSKLTSHTIHAVNLMTQFNKATLPIELWDHYGRLRVVWCSLQRFGYENTIDKTGWLCTSWKRYKTSIGHGDKWNYTMTRFWSTVIWNMQKHKQYKTFNELYNDNENIHSGRLFQKYYGDEIFSEHAKNNWIPPNEQHVMQSYK
jgi:hypothetical protein